MLKATMSWEDVMQEAKLLFLELTERYKDTVDNPRWFMALYKRSLYVRLQHFIDRECRRNATQTNFGQIEGAMDSDEDGGVDYADLLAGDRNEGEFELLVEEAPTEVREVINLIINTPVEVMDTLTARWKKQGKRKPMGNEFLCSMLGYDHRKVNLVGRVKAYFIGS